MGGSRHRIFTILKATRKLCQIFSRLHSHFFCCPPTAFYVWFPGSRLPGSRSPGCLQLTLLPLNHSNSWLPSFPTHTLPAVLASYTLLSTSGGAGFLSHASPPVFVSVSALRAACASALLCGLLCHLYLRHLRYPVLPSCCARCASLKLIFYSCPIFRCKSIDLFSRLVRQSNLFLFGMYFPLPTMTLTRKNPRERASLGEN